MVAEHDILNRVPALLADLSGMEPRLLPSEGAADIAMRLGDVTLVIEAKTVNQAGPIAAAAERVAEAARRLGPKTLGVVAAPFIGELGRRICREAGVGFLDLSGNVHIKAPPLLLHVEGRPNRFVSRGRPSSVFAPKASRITRLLLLDAGRWWRQKDLAEKGDLGAGYVSRTCKRMESERLIERNQTGALRPRDPNLLLDAWQSHYEFDRHDIVRGHITARNGQELVKQVVKGLGERQDDHAVTGLAAAWLLAPFANFRLVAVYVREAPTNDLLDALEFRRDERGANLWLVRPNDEGVFHGAEEINAVSCVCPVQAYVDLSAMPERSDEAAEQLREKRLRWQ